MLKCLANRFPEVGYVQGLSYLAAMLMNYTTPENCYAIMTSLFTEYKIKEQYTKKMPGLEKNFYIMLSLMKKFMPALFKKLKKENYVP